MKSKYIIGAVTLLACGIAYAAQQTTISRRDVEDPVRLRTLLTDNATDAESRIAAVEAGTISGDLTVGDSLTVSTNLTVNGDALDKGTTTSVGDFAVSNKFTVAGTTGNTVIEGTLTAKGATTLATSLSGPLKATSGVVSAAAIDLAGGEVTGVLGVANGGSGASTLTGILKGNGTSAFSAASSTTDYLAPETLTATATTNARVATVTVASSIVAANQIVGWWSATAGGAATATSLDSVVAGANTAVLSDAASPTVVFTTHTDGAGVLTITVGADVERFFNVVQRNGQIKSTAAIVLAAE